MDENVTGLGELSRLADEIEDQVSGELPRGISVDVSGDHDNQNNWDHVNVRIVDPEKGIVFERDYPEKPTANRVSEDYHAVD